MAHTWGEYESLLAGSVIENDPFQCSMAHMMERAYSYTEERIEWSKRMVERWLRTRGFMKMLPSEYKSLLRIQATARRYIVRRKLMFDYIMYKRLAKFDTIDHVAKAIALQKLLKIET